jgi:hypothetical protein
MTVARNGFTPPEPMPPAPAPPTEELKLELVADEPFYRELKPTDVIIDGTEVMVANPPESTVLPFYMTAHLPPSGLVQLEEPQTREEITLSTLGRVKADPSTITDVTAGPVNGDDFEVGLGTGVFKTGAPKR